MNKKNNFLTLVFVFLLIIQFLVIPVFAQEKQGNAADKEKAKPQSEAMKYIEKLKFKPLDFHVPQIGKEIDRVQLKNGMILFLREDHRYPVVMIEGIIRTGQAYEKKERYGVAGLTGTLMRTGGTKSYTPEALNKELDFTATKVDTGMRLESGYISFSSITSQFDRSMKIFAEVLRYPAFDVKELELEKSKIKESILRKNDSYEAVGRREFNKLIFPTYVRGWEYDWNFIKTINQKDLQDWHKRFYAPNNMMFAVVGDFKKEDIIKKFDTLFSDWQQANVDLSSLQTTNEAYKPGVYFVKKDIDQAYILMGHLGITRDNPDKYAISVMNYILGGGGFNSWLMEKVRSDEGLAYSVGSYYSIFDRVLGPFFAYSTTRSDASVKALLLMKAQIEKIRKNQVTQKQLDWAKNSLINSFIFEFEDPVEQAKNLMYLEYNKMPLDYYQKYTENIGKITVADVKRVADKYLQPDKMTIMMVGNPDKYDKPLASIGSGNPTEIKLENPIKE
jgi:predicted Zn-dependent peptidase